MNYYGKAIEICSVDQDWKSIVIAIAKKHLIEWIEKNTMAMSKM